MKTDQVVMILGEQPEGVGVAVLASSVYGDASGLSRRRVTSLLTRLLDAGTVRRLGRGRFALAAFAPKPPESTGGPVEPAEDVELDEVLMRERAERADRERKFFASAQRTVEDARRKRDVKTVAIFATLRERRLLAEAMSSDQVAEEMKISRLSSSLRFTRLHQLGLVDRYYGDRDEPVYLLSERCRRMLGEDLPFCVSSGEEP